MNKYLKSFIFLVSITFIISCKAQEKTENFEKEEMAVNEDKIDMPETDPAFRGNSIIHSSNGPTTISRNLIQDRKGDYWFATFEGIIHYDGKTFTNYTNKNRLRRHRVFSLLEDKKGNIWFGTIGAGVYKYDGKSFINLSTKNGLVNDNIGCIYEDSKGYIWFGTRVGISRYDGIIFTNFTTESGMPDNDINSIIEDKSGKLWIGARGEACTYDGNKFEKLEREEEDPFINVRCIIKDKQDNIWLGGRDGLWRFDGNSYLNVTTNFVGHIYQDQEGNIWTSSQTEKYSNEWIISRYDHNTLGSNKIKATEILKKTDMFFGITQDKKGDIWFGSLNGICRYDGNSFDYFKER